MAVNDSHRNGRHIEPRRRPLPQLVPWVARAVLVIPDAQRYPMDLEYEFYAFALFHRSAINRALHAIGLPLAVASLYAVLLHRPWLAVGVTVLLLGYHLALAVRYRLFGMIPLILGVQVGLWLVADHLLRPLVTPGLGWWQISTLLPAVGSTVAYLGHAAEPYVPPPFAPTRAFVSQAEWLERSRPRDILLVVLCAPAHIAVEAISAPRNIFVLLLVAARHSGLHMPDVDALRRRVTRVVAIAEPPISRTEFRRALAEREP